MYPMSWTFYFGHKEENNVSNIQIRCKFQVNQPGLGILSIITCVNFQEL